MRINQYGDYQSEGKLKQLEGGGGGVEGWKGWADRKRKTAEVEEIRGSGGTNTEHSFFGGARGGEVKKKITLFINYALLASNKA